MRVNLRTAPALALAACAVVVPAASASPVGDTGAAHASRVAAVVVHPVKHRSPSTTQKSLYPFRGTGSACVSYGPAPADSEGAWLVAGGGCGSAPSPSVSSGAGTPAIPSTTCEYDYCR